MNSFVFMMLGMFQDIQERVYEEIIDVIGPDRSVTYKDLPNLQLMERVIKETMRLFPVGPILVRKLTGDIAMGDKVLPEGGSVVLGIIVCHRNPEIWPDPLKFDPDRFLPEEVAKRHPYAWLPFSGGPRNCVGKIGTLFKMEKCSWKFFRTKVCDDGDEGFDSNRLAQIQGVHGIQTSGGHQSKGRSDAETDRRIQTIPRI